MNKLPALFFSVLMICMLTPLQAQNDGAQRLYQEGIFQMEAMGDFYAAIELFEKLISEYPENKSLASRALLMAGRCYEKLGREEAEKAYNRILTEYGDQREIVNEARARLMALSQRARLAEHKGMLTRKVWQGSQGCVMVNISADEKHVALTDWTTGDLALFELATGQTRRLTNKGPWSESSAQALSPVFSNDGKYIAYTWFEDNSDCGLRMINLESGEVQVLLEDKNLYFQALEWAPDGKSVILITNENYEDTRFWQYFIEKDSLSLLKSFNEYFFPVKVAFSPDGKYIAFDHNAKSPETRLNIYSIDLESKEQFELVNHPSENFACGWTPDGTQLVFISNRTGINAIWTIPVMDGKAAGTPEMLKTDVSFAITPIRFTESGSFYYGLDSGSRDVYTASFDPEANEPFGTPKKISLQYEGLNRTPAWSSDGRYIAYIASRKQRQIFNSNAVIIHDLQTGLERNIILDVRWIYNYIAWSPDDKSIAVSAIYFKDGQQLHGLFFLNTASGEITDTIKGGLDVRFVFQPAWSRDGNLMYYFRREENDMRNVFMERNMMTGKETAFFELSANNELPSLKLVYSSSGNMLAFSLASFINKRSDLLLIDLEDDAPKPRSLLTTNYPEVIGRALSFDGEEVVFIRFRMDEKIVQRDFELWSINIFSGESRKILAIPEGFSNISFHPDGKTAVFNMGLHFNPCEIWVIDNLKK